MVDQFSVPLSGSEGDLVHVLSVSGADAALPPNPDTGEPNPTNRILFTTRVGAGIFNPQDADGRFVTAINPRPEEPFVVRVYNAPTLEEATFYEDSALFTPVVTNDVAFFPAMLATTKPIKPDLTPDGMTVSMKESLGLNANAIDTDGDSISDIDELRMGTDATSALDVVPDLVMNMDKNGQISANWELPVHNEPVLLSLGLQAMTVEEVNSRFHGKPFSMQRASGSSAWSSALQGQVGITTWPPSMQLPPSTNAMEWFRLQMQQP